jgi:hypothetical protein
MLDWLAWGGGSVYTGVYTRECIHGSVYTGVCIPKQSELRSQSKCSVSLKHIHTIRYEKKNNICLVLFKSVGYMVTSYDTKRKTIFVWSCSNRRVV